MDALVEAAVTVLPKPQQRYREIETRLVEVVRRLDAHEHRLREARR